MTRNRGFTLIEFMIAITLSLLVLAALTGAFVASSRSRAEVEKANEQIENGRFALQILTDDLEMAGFYSHFNLGNAPDSGVVGPPQEFLAPPDDRPNPCIARIDDGDDVVEAGELSDSLKMHVQGYDVPSAEFADAAAVEAELPCISDVREGTDVVVVRRTATCVNGTANCTSAGNPPFFRASLCATQLNSPAALDDFGIHTNLGDTDMQRFQRDCVALAEARQFLTHIYFVANNDQAGDGVPTLKRAELVAATGNAATDFTIVPLARGIENLQVEYGIDTDGPGLNGDGVPDVFTSNPEAYNFNANGAITGTFVTCTSHKAECVKNWRNVMALKLNLLARNSTPTRDHVDAKVYTLGMDDVKDADNTAIVPATPRCALGTAPDASPIQIGDCFAFEDGFKRHVYQTSVRLNNPAGRLQ